VPSQELLTRFPVGRSLDSSEMDPWLEKEYSACEIWRPKGDTPKPWVFNQVRLPSVRLLFARYGLCFRGRMRRNDFYGIGFPMAGNGTYSTPNADLVVSPSSGGAVIERDTDARFNYSQDYAHLVVSITPDAIARRLAALSGCSVNQPLRLRREASPAQVARQRRLALFLAQELDLAGDAKPDFVIAEIEDAIVTSFLLGAEHNFTSMLANPAKCAPWQVRRAVDYMEQHWDSPITIEKLSEITETSARSLFMLFKKTHDTSPMVYLMNLRLQRARDYLRSPDHGTSVTRIGFMCGFSNLGNFARRYYLAFGEKPSATLKKSIR